MDARGFPTLEGSGSGTLRRHLVSVLAERIADPRLDADRVAIRRARLRVYEPPQLPCDVRAVLQVEVRGGRRRRVVQFDGERETLFEHLAVLLRQRGLELLQ